MKEEKKVYTVQSNDITTARSILNIYERRVLNAIIQNVSDRIKKLSFNKVQALNYYRDSGDPTAVIMKFKASDLGIGSDHYDELRQALRSLREKTVFLETKKGTRITGFLNWAELPPNSQCLTLSVDSVFYQTLFNLSSGYTIFQATVINSLSSIHATKLYEILAKYRDKNAFRLSLDDLRWMTNCIDKYPLYANFKKNVLEVAQRQLDRNHLTDLRFRFKEIKDGRKVTTIQFQVIKTENAFELARERNKISPYWDFTKDLIENAKNLGINLKGKNLELFKEYKSFFGESVLATDLNAFISAAKKKGLGVNYVIGCLRNKYLDHTQTKIRFHLPEANEKERVGRPMKIGELMGRKEKK